MKRLTFTLAVALTACATMPTTSELPQVQAWLAAGGPPPPPQAECPHVARIDLRMIAEEGRRPARRFDEATYDGYFSEVVIPEGFRRPPPDAGVILTAVEPPAGMYSNQVWSVVWREANGEWWYWRQNKDYGAPPPSPPPPPPPPSEGTPEYAEYRARWARGEFDPKPMTDAERWPPVQGRLDPAKAAALEAALGDPCRAWEPDIWPAHPPVKGRRRADEPPPADWTPMYVRIQEMGRSPRSLSGPSDGDSHVGTIRWIARSPG